MSLPVAERGVSHPGLPRSTCWKPWPPEAIWVRGVPRPPEALLLGVAVRSIDNHLRKPDPLMICSSESGRVGSDTRIPQNPWSAGATVSIDLDARPSFAEVMTVRADRMALVRGIVDGLTDTELERICTRAPAPGYPEESRSVADCPGVVMEEECEHHRYAVRDLAVLEGR